MNALPTDTRFSVAYLGPEGSFAHLVAKQRYQGASLKPFKTIAEVFEYLSQEPASKGIVPIENSSGGTIMPTVDGLIQHACQLYVEEELSLDVKLALMGRKGNAIEIIYSHFAPLNHCEKWLKKNYSSAKQVTAPSTSGAVLFATQEPNAAAIGSIENAELYGLDVLYYPIEKDIPNVTQFFVVGHSHQMTSDSKKTSLVVALPDRAGSLCSFLKPFRDAEVNLKRIQSRPIIGQPNTYMFFIEIDGKETDDPVRAALGEAEKVATSIKSLGSYPVKARYQS
jgi:chorismate mutase/prephenate dehydratase